MGDHNQQIIDAIIHYQQCLDKYLKRNNESRILHCISKLYSMPIIVAHLEQTGIGRTVNALRKVGGAVGDAAKSLVTKWKEMVAEDTDTESKSDGTRNEGKDYNSKKYKEESLSSHDKDTDRKSKHSKESRSSSSSHKKHSHSNHKKEAQESRSDRKSRTAGDKSDVDKYSKQSTKTASSEDSSDSEKDAPSNSKNKYKSSKVKTEVEEYKSLSKKDSGKSSLKRRYESSDDEDEINAKHKKLSDNSQSDMDEEDEEEEEERSHSDQRYDKYRSSLNKETKTKEVQDFKIKEKKDNENKHKRESHSEKEKSKSKHKDKSKIDSDRKDDDKKSKSSSSKHHSKKHHKSKKDSSHDGKGKISLSANGIGSSSGASFAEVLGMLEPVGNKVNKKKAPAVVKPYPVEEFSKREDISLPETSKIEKLTEKKLEPLDLNLSNLLPEITPNYRPLGNLSSDNYPKNKTLLEDEALSSLMYSKISRTKVYSGNKVSWGKVPTLFDICTHVLQVNIDALEYTGGVPYSILKPVLERANPDQLYTLEHYNAYLIEDTDELWQLHCQKEFRNKDREEMETWRDMYMRCVDEREAKLRALTANIKLSQDKSLPVRQTKLAYVDSIVKPPRSVARKQAKNGTGGSNKKPLVTPSSRLSALATAGAAGQIAVPNPAPRASSASGNSSSSMKIKKAPLMQKTLAFMKNRCFRR